jgi:hypothetical protein
MARDPPLERAPAMEMGAPRARFATLRAHRADRVPVRLRNLIVRAMIWPTSTLVVALVVSACGTSSSTELRAFKDPVSGSETRMRVAQVGGVEVLVPDAAPNSDTVVVIGGRSVLSVVTHPDRRVIMLLDGKNTAPLIVTTAVSDGQLQRIEYSGSQWVVWDDNADGQAEIRILQGSKAVVEIWIDGEWRERRTVGGGKDRAYYVGTRKVSLSDAGWKYDGP